MRAHLLGDVGFPRRCRADVGPVGRDGDRQRPGTVRIVAGPDVGRARLGRDPERGQEGGDLVAGQGGAQQAVDMGGTDGEADGSGDVGPEVDAAGRHRDRVPGGGHHQLAEALHRPVDALRVAPALEAGRRLGSEVEALRGPGDGHGHEVGGLQQDPGGPLTDLRRLAAHHPGDAHRRALGVADQAVLTGVPEPRAGVPELALHAVQGGHPLPRPRPSDHQTVPGEPVEVVGVGGLAQFEHHVVGGVHHVVDGSHAGQGQAAGQPLG